MFKINLKYLEIGICIYIYLQFLMAKFFFEIRISLFDLALELQTLKVDVKLVFINIINNIICYK